MARSWPVQDAKARFSEILAACEGEGPQIVTKRGAAAAAMVSIEGWRILSARVAPRLKDLLLSEEARTDEFAIPPRKRIGTRKPGKY